MPLAIPHRVRPAFANGAIEITREALLCPRWGDICGMQHKGVELKPGTEAVVRTNDYSCVATLGPNGQWRSSYGNREFLDVVEILEVRGPDAP